MQTLEKEHLWHSDGYVHTHSKICWVVLTSILGQIWTNPAVTFLNNIYF